MSTNLNAQSEPEQASQNIGSRVAKKLSKRFSMGSSSKGAAGEETTAQRGIGQQVMDKGQTFKDEISQGNLDSVKNVAGKGQNAKNAIARGDYAGAAGGIGLKKDNINKESIEKVGHRLFPKRESASDSKDAQTSSIGDSPGDQRDSTQAITGAGGSSSKAGLSQSTPQQESSAGIASGTAIGLTSGAVAGTAAQGNTTKDTIGDELNEQSYISSDVFSEGAAGAAGLKGSHLQNSKRDMNEGKNQQLPSQYSKQGGIHQKAKGAVQEDKDKLNQRGAGLGGIAGGGLRKDVSQGDLSKGALNRGNKATATDMNAAATRQTITSPSTTNYKVTVLQEKVQAVSQKCKNQLGMSASEISQRSLTVDAFFDAVAAERLRWMPRDGSRLDCCLRWASRLAYAVDALRESIGAFAPSADEAARLIWGFSVLLLEVSRREPTACKVYTDLAY